MLLCGACGGGGAGAGEGGGGESERYQECAGEDAWDDDTAGAGRDFAGLWWKGRAG